MQCISYWKPRFPLKSHFRLDLCPKCNCCKWTSCICSKTIICSLLLLHPVSSFLVYISSQTIICHSPNSNVHRICLDRKYSQDMKRAFNQKIKAEKNSIIIFFCSSWLSKSANSLATNLTGGRELEKSSREKAVSIFLPNNTIWCNKTKQRATDLLIAIICSFVDSSFLQQETSKQQTKKIVIRFPLVR